MGLIVRDTLPETWATRLSSLLPPNRRLAQEEHAVERDCKLRSETEIIAVKDVLLQRNNIDMVAPITPARRSFLILSAIERPEGEGGAGILAKDTKCIFRVFSQHDSTFLAHIVEGLVSLSGGES